MKNQVEIIAMRQLEKLTPGGSEFHNDPEKCFEYIKQKIDSLKILLKSKIVENRELKKKLKQKYVGEGWMGDRKYVCLLRRYM